MQNNNTIAAQCTLVNVCLISVSIRTLVVTNTVYYTTLYGQHLNYYY